MADSCSEVVRLYLEYSWLFGSETQIHTGSILPLSGHCMASTSVSLRSDLLITSAEVVFEQQACGCVHKRRTFHLDVTSCCTVKNRGAIQAMRLSAR